MRKETAKARTDGQATRQALIDAAGILAARHGWASVRAKDVCKLAGVSAASVNYWFGGRDELYREVVRQIPEGSIDERLEEFFQSDAEPLEKIRTALETFLMAPRGRSQWHLALWAREVFTGPSEEFIQVVRSRATKRVMAVRQVMAPDVIKEIYPNLTSSRGKVIALEQLLHMLKVLKQAHAIDHRNR